MVGLEFGFLKLSELAASPEFFIQMLLVDMDRWCRAVVILPNPAVERILADA